MVIDNKKNNTLVQIVCKTERISISLLGSDVGTHRTKNLDEAVVANSATLVNTDICPLYFGSLVTHKKLKKKSSTLRTKFSAVLYWFNSWLDFFFRR